MSQTIDRQIQDFLPLLGLEEKKSLLGVIKSFLMLKEENHSNISIKTYNDELASAESEFENGDYISHEDMVKIISQW